MKKSFIAGLIFLASSVGASANNYDAAMRDYFESNLKHWASDPVLAAAIMAQNSQTASYDQAEIDRLDAAWRSGRFNENDPMIQGVLSNSASDYLRSEIAQSDGAITEAFIMDAQGLNVAASAATSDYWQGDEAKFQQTYLVGADSVHFGDVELDDSTGEVQGQISMTIIDAETGASVGAITVGINLTALY